MFNKNIMKINKMTLLLIGLLAISTYAKDFSDVTPNDPWYKALSVFSNEWSYTWINWEAKLDDTILKKDALLFLWKVLWNKSPSIQDLVNQQIISSLPKDNELLTNAVWIKILCNAFKVKLDKVDDWTKPWFVAPYIIAQGVTAVKNEKPFDYSSRRFVLTSTSIFRDVFKTKTAIEMMNTQEWRLMKIRDLLMDPKATLWDAEDLIWLNFVEFEEMPKSNRAEAIKYFNTALLLILESRTNPNPDKTTTRRIRTNFFISKAISKLSDTKPFADDLVKLSNSIK